MHRVIVTTEMSWSTRHDPEGTYVIWPETGGQYTLKVGTLQKAVHVPGVASLRYRLWIVSHPLPSLYGPPERTMTVLTDEQYSLLIELADTEGG